MSYSYTSGPPSGHIYHRSSSNINDTDNGPSTEPAPTRSTVDMRSNEEPQLEGQRYLDSQGFQVPDHPSSLTDMRHVVNSNPGNRSWVESSYGSEAPDHEGMVRPNFSNPNQDPFHYTDDQKAPGLSGQVHQNQSDTGARPSLAEPPNPALDPADYVGISLVGRKFKEVNPSAYYVEKNDTGI